MAALAALVIVLIIFIFRNAQPVKLDFIVVSGHPRLIWLIVGCVLVGGAVGYFLGKPPNPKRHGSQESGLDPGSR